MQHCHAEKFVLKEETKSQRLQKPIASCSSDITLLNNNLLVALNSLLEFD